MSVIPPTTNTYEIEIFGKRIGNGRYAFDGKPGARNRALIIAEIGVNHCGDMDMAAKMVRVAAEAGVDAVKFQLRNLNACYGDLATEGGEAAAPGALAPYMPILRKTALSLLNLEQLKALAESLNLGFLVTPFDPKSVLQLESIGVGAYKIASCDAVNPWVIDAVAATGKPFLVSTGMCREVEVWKLVDHLNTLGCLGRYVIMHAVSAYPTAFADCQLHMIQRYKHNHKCPVGWSGHERGAAVSVAAAALGADVIEKHFTLDRTLPGPDQAASLEPEGLHKLVARTRAFEDAYGDPVSDRRRPRGEHVSEEVMRKSLYTGRAVRAGDALTRADLLVRGPGRGMSPWSAISMEAEGMVWAADLPADHALVPADVAKRSGSSTITEPAKEAPAATQDRGNGSTAETPTVPAAGGAA